MPQAQTGTSVVDISSDDPWVTVHTRVPTSWHRHLKEAARTRRMSLADLNRQLMRDFIIRRHEAER